MSKPKSKEFFELALAASWFDGDYTQESAKQAAMIAKLDFNRVMNEYGNLYAICEEQSR